MVDNNHEAVISVANWEICDEITCHLRKWGGILLPLDWYQAGRGRMCIDFHLLADCAASDVVLDKDCHAGPPVISADEFKGFQVSRVSSGEGVVVSMGDFMSQ